YMAIMHNPKAVAVQACSPPDPCLVAPGSPDCCDANPNFMGCSPIISSESPIIVDTEGEGFHLTSAANGVKFDIEGTGNPIQLAWTAPGTHNAFLVLDRNHNGMIDSGEELFGNVSPQAKSLHPNGFLALAEFDKPENGGNGDGIIDEHDSVFAELRLWI